MASFHEGRRATTKPTVTLSSSNTDPVIEFIREGCARHIWRFEQQTGHKVCAWCNACDDPACESGKRGNAS